MAEQNCKHPVKAMYGAVHTWRCISCGALMTFLEAMGEPPVTTQEAESELL